MKKKPRITAISTEAAPPAVGPYSQAVRAGSFLFVSGQLPLDPETGQMIGGSVADRAEQVIRNIEAICRAGGGDLKSVVRTTVYLTSMDDFAAVNEVYAAHFSGRFPARMAVGVKSLPKGADIAMDAVAFVTEE
ncbi:MAG: RidA family protein [Thermodesulfobacteriota bacterium]